MKHVLIRFLCVWLAVVPSASGDEVFQLAYSPAPADNPLKGFVTYPEPTSDFPHSLVWNYISLRDLITGPDQYNWGPFEFELNRAAKDGRQFIPRFHQDFPGKGIAIPAHLVADGLTVRRWTNTNTQPFPPSVSHTPDYEDPRMRVALTQFIAALGRKYDGDPRLACVPAGLLGTWGEWHNYPREEWFASKEVQMAVLRAYQAAFRKTPVLLRYPAGAGDRKYVPTGGMGFGYHDDSFAWATLPSAKRGDEWFFLNLMRRAGEMEVWKTRMIGGEVRPEVWKCMWEDRTCVPEGQDFMESVRATHATWLANAGVFGNRFTGRPLERALAGARLLGYEFYVRQCSWSPEQGTLSITVTNRGVAPFYADWPMEFGTWDPAKREIRTSRVSWKLSEIQPGSEARWDAIIEDLPKADVVRWLGIRVVHPLKNGRPLRFANETQDRDHPGWLTLRGAIKRD